MQPDELRSAAPKEGVQLLLTVDEAARRLSVSRRYLYQLLYRRTLPSVALGRARRVTARDLEAFVDRLREAAQVDAETESW